MKTFLTILMIVLSAPAFAHEIQHFNPGIFGNTVDSCAIFLLPANKDAIKPSQVITDINEKGIFYAARLIYPDTVSLEGARKSLNKIYKKYEVESFIDDPGMGIWRNENERFTVQLSTTDFECNPAIVQIIYIWLDR